MNSDTNLIRAAIAKALNMAVSDIHVVSGDTNDMTCQKIFDSLADLEPTGLDADQAIPAPGTWAQSQADKNLTRAIGAADEIEMLHHKVLHLEVENKELTRRNDRQMATINEMYERLNVSNTDQTKQRSRYELHDRLCILTAYLDEMVDGHHAVGNDYFASADEEIENRVELLCDAARTLRDVVQSSL